MISTGEKRHFRPQDVLVRLFLKINLQIQHLNHILYPKMYSRKKIACKGKNTTGGMFFYSIYNMWWILILLCILEKMDIL